MRKGFNGLSGIVIDKMNGTPTDGHVYLFINKRKDKIKLLTWEPGGLVLYYKRLEKGVFEIPQWEDNSQVVNISWEMLAMMVQGISTENIIRKKRYLRT